jgi:hypothetical protein
MRLTVQMLRRTAIFSSILAFSLFTALAIALQTGPAVGATTGSFRSLGVIIPWSSSYFTQLDAFSQQVGRAPTIVGSYRDWTIPLINTSQLDGVISRGAIPQVTWEPWDPTQGTNQPGYGLSTITDGSHDAYIQASAQAAAAYGKPFQIRFAPEMNGSWAPWEGSVNGNTPAAYVAAWQHAVSIFRSAGATNVSWVWAPNCGPTSTISSYYPGDSWVDVIGLDGYNWGSSLGKWQSFTEVFGGSYDIVTALSATKPVVITETASADAGGDKAAWITSAYQTEIPTRFPRVSAVIWFDVNKETDWRVDSSASALAAYKSVVGSSAWGGQSILAVPSLRVSSYGRTSVSLGWQAVPLATGYIIEVATDPSFSSPREVAVTGTAVTIGGLQSATRYWFRIRATTASSVSDWSLPLTATTTGKSRK